ncbi:uncharacterized protein LOC114576632 [Exaiptasia diaphana]|uniref:Uncharacterized protein n=1 Tax=Exaiptasia diaphana TaxID=2652724 RepID=A0A913YWM7_EXADI|nr:uncharacterized protein LOC114576632 [Exaiptasia diaphana]
MQEDVQKDPSRIMTKTCRVFLTPQILSRKVYKCMYCCNTRCGRGYYGRLRSGQRVLFCRVSGGICTRTCKEMNRTTAKKGPTKGPSLRPPLATTRQPQPGTTQQPQPGSTQQPKPATTQQPEPETNPPPTQVNGTKFLKKENLFDGLFD